MRRRTLWMVIVGLLVLGGIGWAGGHLAKRLTAPGKPAAGHVQPYRGSPVLLRIRNNRQSTVVVSGFVGDTRHILNPGGFIEIDGVQAPPPWHTTITDAATRAVLYDQQLAVGSTAFVTLTPTRVVVLTQADLVRDNESGSR